MILTYLSFYGHHECVEMVVIDRTPAIALDHCIAPFLD